MADSLFPVDESLVASHRGDVLQPASVSTDKADYAPGERVAITARGFEVGATLEFVLADDPSRPGDDGEADGYAPFAVTDGGMGDLDGLANGQVVTSWLVPIDNNRSGSGTPDALNATVQVTAKGSDGQVAMSAFTDSPPTGNVAKNHQHWADKAVAEWNGDILSDGKSDYFEGEVIPHVYVAQSSSSAPLINGQEYSFDIVYNYYNASGNASGFDYVATYNVSRQPLLLPDASGLAPVLDSIFTDSGDGIRGSFYTVDADIVSVTGPTYSSPTGTRDGSVHVVYKYTGPSSSDPSNPQVAEIYYGLHVALPGGAGPRTNGASAYPGGSLQTTIANNVFSSGALSLRLAPGAIEQGIISGIKFNDLNGNGLKDPGDPGLAGWTIYCDNNNSGTFDAGDMSVTTSNGSQDVNGDGIVDPLGAYVFNVTPDRDKTTTINDPYIVREAQKIGWIQTAPLAGYYSDMVSESTPQYLNQSFGNFRNISLMGYKWNDLNGDGIWNSDDGEKGLQNWTIQLDKDNNGSVDAIATTDANGKYSFLDIGPGTYKVTELNQAGWKQTFGAAGYLFTADSGGNLFGAPREAGTYNFGNTAIVKSLHIKKLATVPGGSADAVGELINYTMAVTNLGNSAIADVIVTDAFVTDEAPVLSGEFNVGDLNKDNLLDLTETWQYTASHAVTQAELDAGSNIMNTAVVTGTGAIPDDDVASVPVEQSPALTIQKAGFYNDLDANGRLNPGDTLNYTFNVANTGNVTVKDVTINEKYFDLSGIAITPPADRDLSPGETQVWSGVHALSQSDIDAIFLDNTIDNIAYATGQSPDAKTVTSNDASAQIKLEPSAAIDLVKVTVYAPPAAGPIIGDGIIGVLAGDPVGWRYTVTNTGNVSLSKVIVIDDAGTPSDLADDFLPVYGSGDANNDGKLGPLETWLYEASGVAIAGHYINIGTAYAYEIPPIELSGPLGPVVGAPPVVIPPTDIVDSDPSDYIAIPEIAIAKDVDANQDGFFADSETVDEGTRLVDYRFTVTAGDNGTSIKVNSFADATLNAAGVTDAALLSAFYLANGSSYALAPNATASFGINNVLLTLDDDSPGQDPYVNTVTVNATDLEGTPESAATASDTATINVANVRPSIQVVKDVDADQNDVFADSETVSEGTRLVDYQFTVTAGNNPSTDVLTVKAFADAKLNAAGVTDAALLAAFYGANGNSYTLAPNASVSFKINNVSLTLNDGTDGQDPFINTVTVSASDDEGTTAIASDTATINVTNATPSIKIVKDVDADKNGVFADSETVAEGTRLVDYQFTVTAGNNASTDVLTVNSFADAKLNAVGVTDAALLAAFYGANGNSYTLAPNASVSFKINNVSLTLDDGATGQDPFINTVTVNASDDEGTTATASDTATINVTNATPLIKIDKTVDANKDGIFNDVEVMLNADSSATYHYQLTNTSPTSTDPLTVNTLVDDRGTASLLDDKLLVSGGALQSGVTLVKGIGDADPWLETGETWTYAWTTTVPLTTTVRSNTNTATVSAHDDEGAGAIASDTASVTMIDYAQIAPTNTTCDQYENGTALDFSTYYASQGGVIQYGINKGSINSTNPGVFFYYTGLSGAIKGDGSSFINVLIDQANNGPVDASSLPGNSEWNFTTVKNNVNVYRVIDVNNNGRIDTTETCSQANSGLGIVFAPERGDVTISFKPLAGSLYVVGVKYDTNSIKGLPQGSLPTVRYGFSTNVYVGSVPDATIEEMDLKGITLEYKFAPLLLGASATTGGEALKQDQLAPVVDAAIAYWAAHGANAQSLQQLRSADVLIGDLGGRLLGETDGLVVRLDDDAAGHGWSTGLDQVATGKVDLYSTLTHEYGHMLGFEHDLLGESLDLGKRRLPFDLSVFPAAANPYAAV